MTWDTLTVRHSMGNCLKVVSTSADTGFVNAEPNGFAARILDAGLECVARYGVAKTTADDIAKAAACSRATLYRTYPNKQAIMTAIVEREAVRLRDAIIAAVAPDTTLDRAITAVIVTAARHLEAIPALQFVLAHEPEAVMPHLTFERAEAGLNLAANFGTALFSPWLAPHAGRRAGDLVARLVLSHLTHTEIRTLTDTDTVHRLVRDFVVPGLSILPNTTHLPTTR